MQLTSTIALVPAHDYPYSITYTEFSFSPSSYRFPKMCTLSGMYEIIDNGANSGVFVYFEQENNAPVFMLLPISCEDTFSTYFHVLIAEIHV